MNSPYRGQDVSLVMHDDDFVLFPLGAPQIPKGLVPHYCSLVSANPRSRPNPRDLLEEMRGHGGYLAGTLISLAVGVEELHVSVA